MPLVEKQRQHQDQPKAEVVAVGKRALVRPVNIAAPQNPRVRTTAQISWFNRSRVVDNAYPTRHMNRIFSTVLHFVQTSSWSGDNAKQDVIVIHIENSNVSTTSGVIGS